MHYPMLKYFSINAHPPSLGIVIEKGDSVDSVRHNLISRLETEQQEGRGSTWPNIAPYRYVINFLIPDFFFINKKFIFGFHQLYVIHLKIYELQAFAKSKQIFDNMFEIELN